MIAFSRTSITRTPATGRQPDRTTGCGNMADYPQSAESYHSVTFSWAPIARPSSWRAQATGISPAASPSLPLAGTARRPELSRQVAGTLSHKQPTSRLAAGAVGLSSC